MDPIAADEARDALAAGIDVRLGPFDPVHLDAVRTVPRERFVRPEDVVRAAEDYPLPLDDEGLATVSAPHAYLLTYRLLALAAGDTLLELGSGSGYGAALAAFIVGSAGRVVTLEIDAALAARARGNLADLPSVRVLSGDAEGAATLVAGARKIACTFAVAELRSDWLGSLREGSVLVAPVGPSGKDQQLVRVVRHDGRLVTSAHGSVRYVPNRSRLAHD